MEEKFNELFLNFANEKRQILIPDEMVATLQKLTSKKTKSMSEKETYLLRNYFIRIVQQKSVLYHHCERTTNEKQPRRIVMQEELFELLNKMHKRLGHGGISLMWKEFSGFYGISK